MAIFVNDREVFVIHFDEIFKVDLVIGINDLFFQKKAEMAAWQANYEKNQSIRSNYRALIFLVSIYYVTFTYKSKVAFSLGNDFLDH